MMSSGKRKREEVPPQYQSGGFLPQQDGAGDAVPEFFEIEVCSSFSSSLCPNCCFSLSYSNLNKRYICDYFIKIGFDLISYKYLTSGKW